ncbi:MAG: hypothetical protein Q9172_004370 [Xanthocarpia lactea]
MSHPIPPPPLHITAHSTTEPPSKHGHHIHRPHRSHHHHHRDKSVPQSAILPSSASNLFKTDNSLGDLLSPLTKVGSRFESHLSKGQSSGQNDFGGDGAGAGAGNGKKSTQEETDEALKREEEERKEREERERRLWKEVERKRGLRGEGDEYLQSNLTSLSTLSTSTTRRLDYTHYSLLSHLSSLLSTLSALSDLLSSSSTHLASFNDATSDFARSMKMQLHQFEHTKFEEQKQRAVDLDWRLKGAREKVGLLEGRLRGAGEQVERVEGAEKEKGKRRRWIWRCLWIACGGIFGILVLLLVTRHGSVEMQARLENQTLAKAVRLEDNHGEPQGLREANTTAKMDERIKHVSAEKSKTRLRTADEWDSRLRMLEEL